MKIDPKLESYLANLDKSLKLISVSERAEIITEIKSHVMDAMEREPNRSLASILGALGEPESVANKYLVEKDLKPGKSSKSPIVKWLTVGFLGTFSIFTLTFLILIWKFTPIIKIDDKNERVTILGGLIDIDGKAGDVSVGNIKMNDRDDSQVFEGKKSITKETKEIRIPFVNGRMEFSTSKNNFIIWDCKIGKKDKAEFDMADNLSVSLNLEKTTGVNCDIKIPSNIKIVVSGKNGKIELNKPQSMMDVKIKNGRVSIAPDHGIKYNFITNVVNGKSDNFMSSADKDAVEIRVAVVNGKIDLESSSSR